MPPVTEHIVKSYEDELNRLVAMITNLGQEVTSQLQKAIQAIIDHDLKTADRIIKDDPKIDRLEHEIDDFAVRLIALRQPVAADLRHVIVALKISSSLERIADNVGNVAGRFTELKKNSKLEPLKTIPPLMNLIEEMVEGIMTAYITQDDKAAYELWMQDDEVDHLYNSFMRELLTYMMEDPRNISPCIHMLIMGKNIERMGDHITNIAENIHYLVHGTLWSKDILADYKKSKGRIKKKAPRKGK
ncbi:MAG: phosphate signaling complex protein PhoU [Alphaproteobacteria bacterium]|jgi:phosphate transport system protein|nr:phosphate signaling complex protein PhoU [Alphaproteobacteria bacterium]MBT5390136.1 phosphate signaling complex protein PhoU [Alphaproteobacteria bacterium]MBT5540136.1 phosphate signaling complex protein PhoU [Alphaproteobacteria bacterium]MBT5655030.1 phosphate signaling complex protein PhoU [Alphaproteobacteria bacterium]